MKRNLIAFVVSEKSFKQISVVMMLRKQVILGMLKSWTDKAEFFQRVCKSHS